MSQNKEEILANFQACTGMEDIGEALEYLEQFNWDLNQAVNSYIPYNNSVPMDGGSDDDVQVTSDDPLPLPPPPPPRTSSLNSMDESISMDESESKASTSQSSSVRKITFVVFGQDDIINITLPETASILDLKKKIAEKTHVLPCRQWLSGFSRFALAHDQEKFSSMNLPNETMLTLRTPANSEVANNDQSMVDRLSRNYQLKISVDTKEETYDLNYPGTKTITEIKNDIYALSDIPVRHQIWRGWPTTLTDDSTCLGATDVQYPVHDLAVNKSDVAEHSGQTTSSSNASTSRNRRTIEIHDSDYSNSDEEFEDASESLNIDDEMFVDNETRKLAPLVPKNVDDEIIGALHFEENFAARYGQHHPSFYASTLDDAIKEACNKPARDRKLLAVYLHHDASVLTNVFCAQLLCFESVLQTLDANFVTWGWDVTHESNREMFLKSVTNTLGSYAAMTIKSIPVAKYPILIIIMRSRSTTEIYTVIHGNVGVNELVGGLMEAVEVWTGQQRIEIREEQERFDRETVKRQQDEAYRESLEADRAKEEQLQRLEEKERREKRQQEEQQLADERQRQQQRDSLSKILPPEPPAPVSKDDERIACIRFRIPDGTLDRRFLTSEKLQTLLNFLTVKGYPSDLYKVLTRYPNRDLTTLDTNKTLMELKLWPQETVIIQER